MASYTFTGSGSWLTPGNWSGGVVPTSTDNASFNSSSGSCTVTGTGAVCANLDFTGYAATFTVSASTDYVTVYGNLTLSTSLSVGYSGSGAIRINNSSATLTSNYATSGVPFGLTPALPGQKLKL